jgi:secreted repeat protein with Y-X4-D motif
MARRRVARMHGHATAEPTPEVAHADDHDERRDGDLLQGLGFREPIVFSHGWPLSADDWVTQMTYNGHPLYLYAPDAKPGDATGQGVNGFGAPWYVLSAAGNAITSSGGSSSSTSGGSSGY